MFYFGYAFLCRPKTEPQKNVWIFLFFLVNKKESNSKSAYKCYKMNECIICYEVGGNLVGKPTAWKDAGKKQIQRSSGGEFCQVHS